MRPTAQVVATCMRCIDEVRQAGSKLAWGERTIESKNGGEATVVYVALNVRTCGCMCVMCGCLGVGGYITKNPNSQIKSCSNDVVAVICSATSSR